ncbi:hypothetical protein PQX77_017570 [Marasmius sp. AFHP31]|nr:hypothetical protein PQX77_017570 [Marasmius sp. AFHP31]
MGYCNRYQARPIQPVTPESELYENTPPSSYDLNSFLPVPEAPLETKLLRLEPLIPSLHADALSDAFMAKTDDPDDVWYYPYPEGKPYKRKVDTLMYIEKQRRRVNILSFAAIDKVTNKMAGVVALGCDPLYATLDVKMMGMKIFPEFRGKHIFKHACFLLLSYALSPIKEGGLGVVRVGWRTPPENVRSQKAAEKIGFKREGIMRCYEVKDFDPHSNYPNEAENIINDGTNRATEDGVVFSMTVHDWLGSEKAELERRL